MPTTSDPTNYQHAMAVADEDMNRAVEADGFDAKQLFLARAQAAATIAVAAATQAVAEQLERLADQGDPDTAQALADAFINGLASDVD
jgi:hypothetical protein